MKRVVCLLFSFASLFGGFLSDTRQYIVVHSASWSSSDALLERYELSGGSWHRVGKVLKVKIGRNGMGWGIGLHGSDVHGSDPRKKEGDGKSPAGIFEIPFAFGQNKIRTKIPFKVMNEHHICVDDSRSKHYNRIVDSRRVEKDYGSFEKMRLRSGLYRYGLFVSHNSPRIPKEGSCIFMHIRRSDGKGTAGCTAMTRKELIKIIKWLDPAKKPLLVQATDDRIGSLLPFTPKK